MNHNLERGVPLYMPNKNGALGLHAAASAGYNDVVKVSLSYFFYSNMFRCC